MKRCFRFGAMAVAAAAIQANALDVTLAPSGEVRRTLPHNRPLRFAHLRAHHVATHRRRPRRGGAAAALQGAVRGGRSDARRWAGRASLTGRAGVV